MIPLQAPPRLKDGEDRVVVQTQDGSIMAFEIR
jgi:hypothetical protein